MRSQRVAILCLPNTLASTVFGPHDILAQAGVLWNLLEAGTPSPAFSVDLVSLDGDAVTCRNGPRIAVSGKLDEGHNWDLVLVSAADVGALGDLGAPLIHALGDAHARGAHLASVCTGAFALAETGLLDARRATTHWGMAALFRERFPRVHLQDQHLVTQDGRLFCSGGITAYQDLSLRLIQFFHGQAMAEQTAQALVLTSERGNQTPFRRFELARQHRDAAVLKAQTLMESSFGRHVGIAELALHCHLSERQFKRRFKEATGVTALDYLQRLRIEIARERLRDEGLPIARIAQECGYSDVAHFRDVFRRAVGVTPLDYRRKSKPVF